MPRSAAIGLGLVCVLLLGCSGSPSDTTGDSEATVTTLTATTAPAPVFTAATTSTVAGGGTTTSTAPGGGAWIMTFDATYEVENYRICNDSLGVDCPATAEVHGEVTFDNPTGTDEVYFQNVGSATQTQTTSYSGCGTKTGSAVLEVDVAITVVGNEWVMWFGGGGYAEGPFIDTVFLAAGCETGPQPAVFFFENIMVPAAPGTYQIDVTDWALASDPTHGRVTTINLAPGDGEKRIHLTITLAQV